MSTLLVTVGMGVPAAVVYTWQNREEFTFVFIVRYRLLEMPSESSMVSLHGAPKNIVVGGYF